MSESNITFACQVAQISKLLSVLYDLGGKSASKLCVGLDLNEHIRIDKL